MLDRSDALKSSLDVPDGQLVQGEFICGEAFWAVLNEPPDDEVHVVDRNCILRQRIEIKSG